MTSQLSTGDTAPEFNLPDAEGVPVGLDEYRGRSVVVYFYPKAATPGCTTEACDFRDNLESLQGGGYSVIGISSDPVEDLASFSADHALTFPLLSDADSVTAKVWGAYGDKEFNGKKMTGTLRSTVVIDGEGKVQLAEYNVDATGHVTDLRSKLGL
ncbi:peroxiredoxin [Arthrobacter roseus]|uniref:peroxiredoxin n=1 Tax=Arthrobacter roseus TaxID=136274 RepID=UPI001964F12E|nr:peroxiredoxin [Arthrobacter roseus]MBM7846968.1 peroxiredoxin Q/BCP [Arthrobacter roseus]